MTWRAGRKTAKPVGLGLICLAAAASLGCSGTIQEAARSAAPAAVEGAVEEAQEPDTRNDIARVLADPEIREASSALTAAIIAGAFDGLTDEQRMAELRLLTDGMVRTMGASLSRTLRDDIAPQLSEALAQAVERSIERALDAETEQRLEAMTQAATRGMMKGLSQSLLDENGQPSPAWGTLLGQVARDVTRQAAFGLDDAVDRAERREGDEPPARVLAALGTLSTLTQSLPLLLLGGLLAFVCLFALPLAALLWRQRRLEHESRAHQQAALALARAIKSTESQAWSNELREHLARETRDSAGAEELQRMLREHAELRLRPSDGAAGKNRPPRDDDGPYVG
jgi:hypothetical protein